MTDTEFRPRPAQKKILAYRGGRMGVSAVPGAGKTFVLALLAADLVARSIDDDQEVLIVTLVNSAVENIKRRVGNFVGRRGLLANVGYRVRTLHGLANDIVHERPGLVGLAEDFNIIDERAADQIREDVVEVWLSGHPGAAEAFLSVELSEKQREWVIGTHWPDLVRSLAGTFIKRAKDMSLSPQELQDRLDLRANDPALASGPDLPLARMSTEIYADYQKSLFYRGGIDFDDLIRLAKRALDLDHDLLARLRHRWPFILEDEAQDSSSLQEEILKRLAGPNGNWVRVGDPNQAINTTFTTADPRYLREFLAQPGVTPRPLENSGRSQQYIIDLANHLVEWTMNEHPEPRVQMALSGPPFIEPTPPRDPQPNPPADASTIYLIERKFSPNDEIKAVVRSLARWRPDHPDDTIAVLVPRNQRGFEVTDALKRAGIPYEELLRSTTSTRKTAGALGNVLKYLSTPSSSPLLARVFEVWRRKDRDEEEQAKRIRYLSSLIRKCRHIETYVWPQVEQDWLAEIEWAEKQADKANTELLESFRERVRRWQEATVLPIDQLVLTIAQDLFIEPAELALSHKLAVMLRLASENNPSWRLSELTTELAVIARNQRRFLGFDEQDAGFEPTPGVVTVSTLHKAKGLEWDRVYVMSVNNYNFPSAQPYDEYISERWFVRDRLNVEAEALQQLESLVEEKPYQESTATRQARLDYVSERLRLLYVGITRARKDVILTWNTGRSREAKLMAVPLIALHAWWQETQSQ